MIIKRILPFTMLSLFVSHFTFAETINVKVLDNKGNLLPNMVVYLEPPKDMNVHVSNNLVEVAQIDKSFSPYIGVMQKGSSVKFNNKDNISHHIYSPAGENKFAFKINAGQEYIKDDFSSTGSIAMGCNIHDWMSGHLLIIDTPYFTKTNDDGIASIDVKEKGEYNVVVWHPQMRGDKHTINKLVHIDNDYSLEMKLLQPLDELPSQKNEDDFDFLSDY